MKTNILADFQMWISVPVTNFFPATKFMSLFIYFKISQNSQENACAGVSPLIKLQMQIGVLQPY